MTTCAIAIGEVTSLQHEAFDDSMVNGIIIGSVTNEFLEVLNVCRCLFAVEFNGDLSSFKGAVSIGPRHLKDDVFAVSLRGAKR